MKRLSLYMLSVLVCGCNLKPKQTEGNSINKGSLDSISYSEDVKRKLFIDFEKKLITKSIDSLPYVIGKNLFKYCCLGDFESEYFIKKIYKNNSEKIESYYKCESSSIYPDSILFIKKNRFNHLLKEKNQKFFIVRACEILKSFKRTDEISIHIATSIINDIKFLFVFTYSKFKIVDHYPLGVLEKVDEYNETAIHLSKDYKIEAINTASYENLPGIFKTNLSIDNEGFFHVINESVLEIDIERTFHDYKNDYKEFTIPQISTEEKKTLFTKYIPKIPSVSLPYNSGDFYKHMEIASPEEGKPSQTVLHHNQLKFYDEVTYFFSNNPNDIAFKKEGNDYKEGYYFYPIGKFDITEEKVGVLYLYQSFCNYHPTIYVQLNTYDSQGNIITTKILDRRFYSGAYRFLSSIEIQENLKIDIKSFIQDYEDYGYEGIYEQKQPEIKETFLQINNDGSITK